MTDVPPDDTAGEAPAPGRSWRDWLSAHRGQVKLIAGLLVVALVGTLVLVWVLRPGPKDIVADYLEAIHDGDTDAALEIAGDPDTTGSLAFLSSAALADDWTVDSVVERHRREYDADVDFTISTGNTTAQGRFHVVRDDKPAEYGESTATEEKKGNGDWRIEEPLIRIELDAGGLDFAELGDMRRELAAPRKDGNLTLLVFPGVYKLYPSLAKRASFDPGVLVAVPSAQHPTASSLSYSADLKLTEAGTREAQRAIDTYIDTCAKKSDVSPGGCPFSANGVVSVRDDVVDLTWRVVTYPEARFVTGPDGFGPVVRKLGTTTVTATVTRDGGPPATVTATCEFGFANMSFDLTTKGFSVGGAPGDEFSNSSRSECY